MRCPLCGFPLMQVETEPFLCTHPAAQHKLARGNFGLEAWVAPPEPPPVPEAPVEPDAADKKRDKQK